MTDFLIKSTISLILFLGFYHLVLEKEKMHQFNRFYLLFSIVISLAIPFITFEIIKEIPVAAITEPIYMPIPMSNETIPVIETIDYTPIIFWSLYGLTTLLLTIRFGKNIWKLMAKSSSNPTVKYKNAQLVLVDEKTLPHTFLNSIFINFDDYNQRNIEDELYTHELVHVTQKHTLDILFIEFLKTVFWFNPVFYYYKKAIQLNHEFFADEKVVQSYNDVPFYQSLLLRKGNVNATIYLASNLNYLVTKKRLIMMTKSTSKSIVFLKKIAITPILAGLIYFFCIEIVAQEKVISDRNSITENSKTNYEEEFYKNVRIKYYESRIKTKDGYKFGKLIFNKKYQELTENEKKDIILYLFVPKPLEKKSPTTIELNEFKNSKKYAIWIDGKNVPNNELNKYNPKDIAHFSGSVILKNARTKKHPQPFQYWFYTHPYFEKEGMGKQKKKYTGEEIVIWKEGNTKTNKSKVTAEIIPTINDTIKKKPLEKVTINGEVYEKVGEKYFNEKGSFDVTGKNKFKEGYIKINNQTCFYVTNQKGEIKYFDPTGNSIDIYGIKIEPKSNTIEEVPTKKQETDVYNLSDLNEKPEFELGLEAFYKYIGANFKIPEEVTKNKLKGRVFASFIVEKDGSLSNIKILRDMGYGTGEEAVRVLKESPKWKPGKIDGKPVRTMYSLPISIKSE
ncbi:energy transducer TonB [Flavobacterium buctense]|uniref:Energy transducer TonB n=1 Tax=Flavobacterium buctense TaxID=1648146 RepID=A0ABU9E1D3_9FLAO|nr:energy transducer TonB [Flavobacterium buctense]